MATRKRRKAKASKKSKVTRGKRRVKKASRRKLVAKRRARPAAAATKRKRKVKRTAAKRAPAKRVRKAKAASGKYIVALVLKRSPHKNANVAFFGGTINRKPYVGGRSSALQFGNLPAAKYLARQLIRLRVVKKVGVYKSSDSDAMIRQEMQAAVKKRKKR